MVAVTMTQIRYPVAPTTTPLKGTLLDLVTPGQGIEWQDGRGLFESFNCLEFKNYASFCGPNNKAFEEASQWINGFRFAVYGGLICNAVGLGMDREDRQAEIERVFRSGESTAVERALMDFRFTDGPDDLGTGVERWQRPVDITPSGGAVKPKVGLALLEEFAANTYVGRPTIHVPRSIGSLLLNENGAVWDGSILRTNYGSGLVAGAGYSAPNRGPNGDPVDDANERWIYATGEVLLQQGDLIVKDEMNYTNNQVVSMVERPYIAAVDCFAAAIRVTIEE